MAEDTKPYVIVKFGWDSVVIPKAKGLQLLDLLSEAHYVTSEWVDNKQVFRLKQDKQEVTIRFLTEAEYVALHLQGDD